MSQPRRRLAAALATVSVLTVLTALPVSGHEGHTIGLTASDNTAAAIELSQRAHAAGGGATEVLLGRDDLFSDTLSAASATGRGLLLTSRERLDPRVAAELDRLGTERVTILGGTAAVADSVEEELLARGHAVERLWGTTRIETAVALARHYHPRLDGRPVIVARAEGGGSTGFADTLAGSALAHALRAPVLLTRSDALDPGVADYLEQAGATLVILAGGTAALSTAVEARIQALGISVERAAGTTRTGTALAQNARRGLGHARQADRVLLLDGYGPDAWAAALAAGAWAAATRTAVVLSSGAVLDDATADFLAASKSTQLVCTSIVPAAACRAAERAMHLPPFATVGGITLHQPSTDVEMIGFHESNHDGAQQMTVAASAPPALTLSSRGRGTPSRSAADIVMHPGRPVRAPVTGTVRRSGTYTLYCRYRDDYVVIEPDDHPGWEVKLLHIDGVRVRAGDRVAAGTTVLAPRPTKLPFRSQVDDYSSSNDWPHAHLEVIDPSIPDRPSGGC